MRELKGAIGGLVAALLALAIIQMTIILVEVIGVGYTAAGWFIIVMVVAGIAEAQHR